MNGSRHLTWESAFKLSETGASSTLARDTENSDAAFAIQRMTCWRL
jgi:hypothetical protein